jgi:hypothetical protein
VGSSKCHALAAELSKGECTCRIRAEENAVPAIQVIDHQGRLGKRQPGTKQIVGSGDVLLGVVNDEVTIAAQQIAAELREREQMLCKDLDLK